MERIEDEGGRILQAKLLHEVSAVRLGGSRADPQPLADGGIAKALGGQVEDFALPCGERLVEVDLGPRPS